MANRWRVLEAAREIRAGAVIAYPTEAVWGLGCDPWNEEAVDRLLPEWVTGVHDTVALRVSDHPLVRDLCAQVGPLISTSANPQGRPAARTRIRVEQYFRGQVDLILGGALGGRKNPSLIRDLATGQVVRPS